MKWCHFPVHHFIKPWRTMLLKCLRSWYSSMLSVVLARLLFCLRYFPFMFHNCSLFWPAPHIDLFSILVGFCDLSGDWYNECNDRIDIDLTSTGLILGDYLTDLANSTGQLREYCSLSFTFFKKNIFTNLIHVHVHMHIIMRMSRRLVLKDCNVLAFQ